MGCRYSRVNGCYSITCCCCLEVDEACSWVAIAGLVWGGVATLVDFISANLPEQHCLNCLDHDLNAQLSLAAGCINAVQWLASVLLLIGAKLGNRWLLLPWLSWGVVSLVMQAVWLALTLRHMPSVRAATSLFQLGWGAHFFLVVKTQYTRMALSYTLPEEMPFSVPPNTPVRKHKRRWRRLHPACQPPIRTLVGAALRLQRALQHAKKLKELESEEEEEQEEQDKEEEEEEEDEIRVTVDRDGVFDTRRGEETCNRRRSGWKAYEEWKTDGSRGEQGVFDVIVHSSYRDVRGRVETRRAEDKEKDDQDEKKHKDEKDGDEVGEDEKKPKDECGKREADEEEEEKTTKDECKKDADDDEERTPKDGHKKDTNDRDKTIGNEEGDGGGQCEAIHRGHGEAVAMLWRASNPSPVD